LPPPAAPGGAYPPGPQAQAAAGARAALQRAASSLRPGTESTQDAHPAVRHLSAAATCLSAGRDLLHTHVPAGWSGRRRGSSYWAPTITSAPVTAALLSELAHHARVLAHWAAQLIMTGPAESRALAADRLVLHDAISGLWITATAIEAAQHDNPPSPQARQLAAAIPASIPPPRRPPGDSETVNQLCDGITITAERLRRAARPDPNRWSPAATSDTWRRSALACAITTWIRFGQS
jgi:hypothetical protein